MKFRRSILIVGLCALILQFGVISCQNEAGDETDVAQETTDSEAPEETVNSDADNTEENSNNEEENTNDANDEEGEQANEPEQTDEDSPDESSDAQDNSGDENGESDGEEQEEPVEEVYVPPPVGTELPFDLDTSIAGFSVNIYFTQVDTGLRMHCDVSAQAGTASAALFPNEFEDEEETDSQDEGADENSPSDNTDEGDSDANDDDANVVENNNLDAENTDPNAQEDTGEENVDDNSDDTQSPSDENPSNDDENAEMNNSVNEDETDDGNADSEVNNEDGNTGRRRQTRGSCTGDMPHLYLLKHTECCDDPNTAGCENTEAYKLGCLDKTGSNDHDYTDLKYEDVEAMCLAITPSEVAAGFRRVPKFIASGPSFFRTFIFLNFNNINFLSSGTKTITSNPSTGAVSVNFPSYIPQSSGGSYTPGFFDTLPYIRLEGLTADYINVVTILLILTYVASIFLPLLNLGPLVSQLTAPFERMGDFASERMDILANKVKASIRKYKRRRYYNDVRRVDYDLNYEYIDDDYYYYDK